MKEYDNYEEVNIMGISEIPKHWYVSKINYFSSIRTGGTPNKENNLFWDNGIINWMSSGEVNKEFVYETNNKITEEGLNNSNANLLPINSVMIALNGQGKTKGMVAVLKVESTCNQSLAAFICDEAHLHYLYLFFYLKSRYKELRGLVGDGLRDGLTIGLLKSLRICIPPLNEQVTIGNFLNKKTNEINKLIEQKEKILTLIEEKRQATITEAVTKGLNPNVKMTDSGVEWIGEIPKHWGSSRLDFNCSVKARLGWKGLKASEYVDDGYLFLSTPNIKSREIDYVNVNYITKERYLESPEIMLKQGDVLLAKDGSTLGIVNVVRELPRPATVNGSIAVIRPNESIHSTYLYYYLSSNYMQHVIQQLKDGMGVPHLFQSDIRKFKLIVPPFSEQIQIANYLDEKTSELESVLNMVKIQIEKLKEYRQSLIYEAVTGKIDVREYEKVMA